MYKPCEWAELPLPYRAAVASAWGKLLFCQHVVPRAARYSQDRANSRGDELGRERRQPPRASGGARDERVGSGRKQPRHW